MTRIKISLVLRVCKDVRKSATHHLSSWEWEQWMERNWRFIVRGIKASPTANQVVKIIYWSVMWVDAVLNQWTQYHYTKTRSREHELKQQYLEQKDKPRGGVLHSKGLQGPFDEEMNLWSSTQLLLWMMEQVESKIPGAWGATNETIVGCCLLEWEKKTALIIQRHRSACTYLTEDSSAETQRQKSNTQRAHTRGACDNSINCLYVTSLQPLHYSCRPWRRTTHHRAPQCIAGTELAELPPKFPHGSLSANWNQHTCAIVPAKLCFSYGN